MRDAYGECHSAKDGCDLGDVPCCSCLEQGRAKSLPARKEQGCTAPITSPGLSSGGPQKIPLYGFFRAIGRLCNYSNALTSQILRIIPPLLLPVLLGLPLYYLSQASELLAHSDGCRSDYDQWIEASNSLSLIEASPVVDDIVNGTDHHARVPNRNLASTALNGQDVTNGSSPHNIITPVTLPLAAIPPDSVVKLQYLWFNYIDSRVTEWRILTTTACVFVAASPTIFQIPEAGDDPITRSAAFLALCRALSGIIFGPTFLIYFRKSRAKSVHFAVMWCQKAGGGQRAIGVMQWSPWIILSLPAVATCWAALFYLFAIFSFIWRTGSTADPSPLSANNPGYHPMAVPLAMVVRITITAATVMDIGCMVWVWRTLRSTDFSSKADVIPARG